MLHLAARVICYTATMDPEQAVLRLLADGQCHTSRELSHALGVAPSALERCVHALCAQGVEVLALPASRYRLSQPVELFDVPRVLAALGPEERILLDRLDVFFELDSTNRFLCEQPMAAARGGHACLADRQTAGKGRRGRCWVAPLGNVYLSVAWSFALGAAELQGLSLAAGVATARVADVFGAGSVGLKWPNDVICDGGKLGGVLIEIVSSTARSCRAVVGIGLNVAMAEPSGPSIDQPWSDLSRLAGRRLSKNAVAARLLAELLRTLDLFEREGGFPCFRAAWETYDRCRDQAVVVHAAGGATEGIARGVDERGRLLLEVHGSMQTVVSGDVSLRIAT